METKQATKLCPPALLAACLLGCRVHALLERHLVQGAAAEHLCREAGRGGTAHSVMQSPQTQVWNMKRLIWGRVHTLFERHLIRKATAERLPGEAATERDQMTALTSRILGQGEKRLLQPVGCGNWFGAPPQARQGLTHGPAPKVDFSYQLSQCQPSAQASRRDPEPWPSHQHPNKSLAIMPFHGSPIRSPAPAHAAASSGGVPANVKEARAWIAA